MPPTGGSGNPDVRATSWLKPDLVEAMRDACLTDRFPDYLQDRNEAAIVLLYDAGQRASELCTLDVDHFDLDAGTVYPPSDVQKHDPPPATLSLGSDTVRLLRQHLRDRWKDTQALFPSRSSPRLTTRSLERMVKAAQDGEMEIAASYVDALFFIQAQAPDLTETYHDQTEEMVEEEEAIRQDAGVLAEVMIEVKDWAHEPDYDVAQWFEAEQEAEDE